MAKSNKHTKTKSGNVMTTGPLAASRKITLQGKVHHDVRVAMREITVSSGPPQARHNGDREGDLSRIIVYTPPAPTRTQRPRPMSGRDCCPSA